MKPAPTTPEIARSRTLLLMSELLKDGHFKDNHPELVIAFEGFRKGGTPAATIRAIRAIGVK